MSRVLIKLSPIRDNRFQLSIVINGNEGKS